MYFADSIIPPILISSIVSQVNQYCKTRRKTIVLQMDISGKTSPDGYYKMVEKRIRNSLVGCTTCSGSFCLNGNRYNSICTAPFYDRLALIELHYLVGLNSGWP